MPTYEYVCEACEHEFDEFQSMSAALLKKCPACAKNKLRRKIGTGAGIIFKGGGFYETDYRSDSYKQAAKAEKESGTGTKSEGSSSSGGEASSAPKAETKADSKPTAKAESKPAAKKTPAKAAD